MVNSDLGKHFCLFTRKTPNCFILNPGEARQNFCNGHYLVIYSVFSQQTFARRAELNEARVLGIQCVCLTFVPIPAPSSFCSNVFPRRSDGRATILFYCFIIIKERKVVNRRYHLTFDVELQVTGRMKLETRESFKCCCAHCWPKAIRLCYYDYYVIPIVTRLFILAKKLVCKVSFWVWIDWPVAMEIDGVESAKASRYFCNIYPSICKERHEYIFPSLYIIHSLMPSIIC